MSAEPPRRCSRLRPCRAEDFANSEARRCKALESGWGWGPSVGARKSVRGGGGAPPPVQQRLRPHLSEDMQIRAKVCAPAAMPSRGHANPRRGIGVSSGWGWGPSACARKSVRGGGGAPPPVQQRLRPHLSEDMQEYPSEGVAPAAMPSRGLANPRRGMSLRVRAGGGAPASVQESQFVAGVGPRRQRAAAPAATPERGHADPSEGVSVSSWRGWGPRPPVH